MNNNKKCAFFLLPILAGDSVPALAEGFLEDSRASLALRNFYMNRDFRDGAGRAKSEEWAQGFLFDYRSGYTEGTLGVGLDLLGKLGVRLDSGAGVAAPACFRFATMAARRATTRGWTPPPSCACRAAN
ncbi:putative porin [Pseudomonas aeruginosa]|nr:putative porin [Pseudomonas aeruginosa]